MSELTMADIRQARREGRNEAVALMSFSISRQQEKSDGQFILKDFTDEQLETIRNFVRSFEK